MDRTTFLENYRIRLGYDGSPYEPDRSGPAISYEAVDQRTAEPVSITLIPAESIDPAERKTFEEELSAAQKLRHVNVAKVLDFGREGDDYVYVSERLAGETLGSWVHNHGPMAADAVLRVAEQIVSVLSSAGFHKLPYPSIQPGDVMLVPGQTAEGSWPLVKVTNFGLPALVPCGDADTAEKGEHKDPAGQRLASNQAFSQPTRDIRSEIYSLGVTLYCLLTGVALSTEALESGPKFSGFPKPLRALLGRMLHRNPDQRPKDLLVVTEMIRECSEKIERRRALSDRYGLPLRTDVAQPRKTRPRRLVRTAVALAALLILAAAIAPVIFPESFGKVLRAVRNPKPVGVLIGVPESSSAPAVSSRAAQPTQSVLTTAPSDGSSQPGNPNVSPQVGAGMNPAPSANPPGIRPADSQQAQIASAKTQAAAPNDSAQNPGAATTGTSPAADTAANSSAQVNNQPPPAPDGSMSQAQKKSAASTSRRARAGRRSDEGSARSRSGSVRARVVGITSDGRLILRLPSGRTAIVAPDEGVAPRRRSRAFIDRDPGFGAPPGFGPDYFPDD